MIKDLSTSIKAALYEKVKAPILGTYTLSWLVYNWKGIIPFIFGGGVNGLSLNDRINNFDQYLHSDSLYSSLAGPSTLLGVRAEIFIIPALFTLITIFILPVAQNIVFRHNEKFKAKSLKFKEENDSGLRLTIEQSREIRKELASYYETSEMHKEHIIARHTLNYESLKEEKNVIEASMTMEKVRRVELEKQLEELQEGSNKLYEKNMKLIASESKALKELSDSRSDIENLRREVEQYVQGNIISEVLERQIFRIIRVRSINEIDNLYSSLVTVSESDSWQSALNNIIVMKYIQVESFDEADGFFRKLIAPRLSTYSRYSLNLLKDIWKLNDFINKRPKSPIDLGKIDDALKKDGARIIDSPFGPITIISDSKRHDEPFGMNKFLPLLKR